MAKPYGLANQKLCYIQIYKMLEKRQRMLLRMVGEYESKFCSLLFFQLLFPINVLFCNRTMFDPHVARLTQDVLATNNVQTLTWPVVLFDLNQIENSFKTDFCTGFLAPNSFGFMARVPLVIDLKCFRKCDFPVNDARLYKFFSSDIQFRIP